MLKEVNAPWHTLNGENTIDSRNSNYDSSCILAEITSETPELYPDHLHSLLFFIRCSWPLGRQSNLTQPMYPLYLQLDLEQHVLSILRFTFRDYRRLNDEILFVQ